MDLFPPTPFRSRSLRVSTVSGFLRNTSGRAAPRLFPSRCSPATDFSLPPPAALSFLPPPPCLSRRIERRFVARMWHRVRPSPSVHRFQKRSLPSLVWALPRKKRNQLAHALNGNTPFAVQVDLTPFGVFACSVALSAAFFVLSAQAPPSLVVSRTSRFFRFAAFVRFLAAFARRSHARATAIFQALVSSPSSTAASPPPPP